MTTVGPSVPSILNRCDLSHAQILLRNVNAEKHINEATCNKFNVSLFRQLTSGLDGEST